MKPYICDGILEYDGEINMPKGWRKIYLSLDVEALVRALQEISNSPHCVYPVPSDQYQIGVTDGHRCAANIAKKAIEVLPL